MWKEMGIMYQDLRVRFWVGWVESISSIELCYPGVNSSKNKKYTNHSRYPS